MSVTLTLTDFQIFTALRSFLLAVLPVGTEVMRTQENRVAEPNGPDFVMMTSSLRTRLETNIVTFVDGFPGSPGTRSDMQPISLTVQIDVHGPNSADNAQIVSTMFRSDWAVRQFATSGFDVTPLYAGDPHQAPFVNGEQQVENRWTFDAVMQCNPIVTTPQDFAGEVHVGTRGIINVDAAYPP